MIHFSSDGLPPDFYEKVEGLRKEKLETPRDYKGEIDRIRKVLEGKNVEQLNREEFPHDVWERGDLHRLLEELGETTE